jgi:D-beta-D-heptose 7-phosphate kinase/D-beta-D-heptose 1-phosphate adenosyltransferase
MDSSCLNFADNKIIVVGDVMLDVYYMGEVCRLSPEAPVPIVRVKEKTWTLGGAGNVALNLVKLGCRTVLLGVRGEGRAGKRLSELNKENGIVDGLIVDSNHTTTSKTRVIGQGQQLIRLDEENVWKGSEESRRQLLAQFEEAINDGDAVILSDYGKGVLNHIAPSEIIWRCKERQIPIFVDSKAGNWERFRGATCITPNIREVEGVVGSAIENDEETLAEIAQSLRRKYGFDWFVITRGPDGMCLVGTEASPLFAKAMAREVYDVSGAGDTVIATLAAGVVSGLALPRATELANIAAGIVVGKLGSQPISIGELEAAFLMNAAGAGDVCSGKMVTQNVVQLQAKAWQAIGEKIVFTNGCFDLIHAGHVHVLDEAKKRGDRLVVGVNSDASVRRLKGSGRPIVTQKDRVRVLSSLGCVDLIVPFEEDTPLSLIDALRPDVLVKGGNCSLKNVVGRKLVESYGGKVQLIPFLDGYSTTDIERDILRNSMNAT